MSGVMSRFGNLSKFSIKLSADFRSLTNRDEWSDSDWPDFMMKIGKLHS